MQSTAVRDQLRAAGGDLSALAAVDVAGLDIAACGSTVSSIRRAQQALAVLLTTVARHAEALRRESGAGPGADVVAGNAVSARTAAREAERAALLETTPVLDAAFTQGSLGAEHVDVVASTLSRLEPAERELLLTQASEMVEEAAGVGPDVFARSVRCRVQSMRSEQDAQTRLERQRRSTRLHKGVDRDSGMYWLRAEFDPVTGAGVFSALDRATDRPRGRRGRDTDPANRQQAAAHTLAQLVTSGTSGSARPHAEVLVLIDYQTLVEGLHDASVCETTHSATLPPSEVRRLACGADLVPVVLGAEGEVLDVGRRSRLATRAQRRALRVMFDSCIADGCDIGFDACDIHHLDPWNPTGQTDLDNLRPLCSRHHHLVHDGRLTLDRQLVRGPTVAPAEVRLPGAPEPTSSSERRHDRRRRQASTRVVARAP